jgi:hypothetical protein
VSEPKKITSINEFIETKLASQIGAGKRYHNQAHYEQVRSDIIDLFYPDGIDDHRNFYDENFIDPDRHGITYRQSIILASLLSLTRNEFLAFSKLIESKKKLLPADYAPPGSPDYMGLPAEDRLALLRDTIIKIIDNNYISYYRLKKNNEIDDYPEQTIAVTETHTLDRIDLGPAKSDAVPAKPVEPPQKTKPAANKPSKKEKLSGAQLKAAAARAEKMVDLDALLEEAEKIPEAEVPDIASPQKPAPVKAADEPVKISPKAEIKDKTPAARSQPIQAPAKIIPPAITTPPTAPAVIAKPPEAAPILKPVVAASPSKVPPIANPKSNKDFKAIFETAANIQQAIADILELQTGTGKRFESREHIKLVMGTAAAQFRIDADVLTNPDRQPLTIGQSQLLGAIMGLGNEDFLAFRRLIEAKSTKFSNDQSNPYRDRLDPHLLENSINALIKKNAPSQLALSEAYQKLQSQAISEEEQGLLQEHQNRQEMRRIHEADLGFQDDVRRLHEETQRAEDKRIEKEDIAQQQKVLQEEHYNRRQMERIRKDEIGFGEDLENLNLTIQEERAYNARILEQQEKDRKASDEAQKTRDKQIRKAEAEQKKLDREAAKKRRAEAREARAENLSAERAISFVGYKGGEKTRQDLARNKKASEAADNEKAALAKQRTENRTTQPAEINPSSVRRSASSSDLPDNDVILEKSMPDGLKGPKLLEYAYANNLTFSELIKAMHERAEKSIKGDISQNKFAEVLGIDRSQYEKIIGDQLKAPKTSYLNQLAIRLGAASNTQPVSENENEEELTAWRRYMLGISTDINQDAVNHCFDPSSRHAMDMDGYGSRRTVAMAKFFKLLMDRYGFTDRTQLAKLIAQRNGLDEQVAIQMRSTFNNLAGGESNADVDIAGKTQDEIASIVGRENRVRLMPKHMAEHVSNAVFPDDSALKAQCMDFLTHEKYKTPPEVEAANKSVALKKIRSERGDNWGKRSGQQNQTFSERG